MREQIRKLKELVSSDKMLKQMKHEYNECVTECKQILEHLENKVQHNLLADAVGSEQAALMDVLDNYPQSTSTALFHPPSPISTASASAARVNASGVNHEHLNMNRLSSLTMSHFEQNFV